MAKTLFKKKKNPVKIIFIVFLIILAVFSVLSFVIVKINFDDIFGRTVLDTNTYYLRYSDIEENYPRELISFMSGENKLQGYLYGAENTKGLVVICHGLGGGAENYTAQTISFVDAGYKVFGYDNTGCYNSEGANCIGLAHSVTDLDAALTFIEGESRFEGLPVYLYGHSWGGYAVTAIFNYDHDIAASVSVAGFNKPMQMIIEWARGMMGGFAYVEYPYIWLYQKTIFGNDLDVTAVDGINSTDTPIMIVHGTEDHTIGFEESAIIAYRDEISNPNVKYSVWDNEHQNGHSTVFLSQEATLYADELDEEYDRIYDEYNGDIPEDIEKAFFDGTDKVKASELNKELTEEILEFFDAVNYKKSGEAA